MIDDRTQPNQETGRIVRHLDELIAHSRFAAVLDAIAKYQAAGQLDTPHETSVALARCRALLGLGRWKEASEASEKKLEELYALEPAERRAILEFHIAAGRAAWR